MTTSSITLRPRAMYRGPADRLAVSLGAALVSWANRRAAREAVSHERRALAIEQDLALMERQRVAFRIHELR